MRNPCEECRESSICEQSCRRKEAYDLRKKKNQAIWEKRKDKVKKEVHEKMERAKKEKKNDL